jgi:hypothetical protein
LLFASRRDESDALEGYGDGLIRREEMRKFGVVETIANTEVSLVRIERSEAISKMEGPERDETGYFYVFQRGLDLKLGLVRVVF